MSVVDTRSLAPSVSGLGAPAYAQGAGEFPATEAPYGEAPYGEAPYGEAPYGEAPYGEAPYGEAPYGEAAYGEAAYGEAPYGEAPYGEAPYGEAPYGEAPYGEAPYGEAPYGEAPYGEKIGLESPFLSGASFMEALPAEVLSAEALPAEAFPIPFGGESTVHQLESPFLSSFSSQSEAAAEADREGTAFGELVAALHDEAFDGAVAHLIDEAAAAHLASQASWSSQEAAPGLAETQMEAWIAPLAQEVDRFFADTIHRLSPVDFSTLREAELNELLESTRPIAGHLPLPFQNFLGGVFNKVTNVVKGAVNLAKRGVGAAWDLAKKGLGALAPIGWLLNKLKDLVKPLLREVLKRAIGKLPVSVQPVAQRLATHFLGEGGVAALEDGGLAREFDVHAARLMLAQNEAAAEAVVSEVVTAAQESSNALAELDAGRARLAQELTEVPPGESPVTQIQQFIPLILAARPIIRLGLSLIGRDKVVSFIADKVAGLIKGVVGQTAARLLSQPLVDIGLSMLGLETSPIGEMALVGEALASTVEETVAQVLELPAEVFEDPARLEAEIHQAFTEAAARNLPAERLRPDLPEHESSGAGVWILMPRAARPAYRYKKFSRIFVVPITRQMARSLPTADEGTMETFLQDRGVTRWPAEAEVHLYETLPGSHPGHIAQFEGEGTPVSEVVGELQPLTPEAASLLLREPGLGRARRHHRHDRLGPQPIGGVGTALIEPPLGTPGPWVGGAAAAGSGPPVSGAAVPASAPVLGHAASPVEPLTRPLPAGNRFFRIRVRGPYRPSARPRHRLQLSFNTTCQPPSIRIASRFSEREAQAINALLGKRNAAGLFLLIKSHYVQTLPPRLTAKLLAEGSGLLGAPMTSQLAEHLSRVITEGMNQAVSDLVKNRSAELGAAARDSRQGLTLFFSMCGLDRSELRRGVVRRPQLVVRAGWHHV